MIFSRGRNRILGVSIYWRPIASKPSRLLAFPVCAVARRMKSASVGLAVKNWDLAFVLADKPRLLISLKSILKNLSGTVPNRLDDLMGEAANVQQLSPEIVIGYVVIMDEAGNSTRKDGTTWIEHFKSNLAKIAIRRAPLWNQGLLEGVWLIRVDSRKPAGSRIVETKSVDAEGVNFFKALIAELYRREPTLKPS
jgi:hypothetical protein